MLSIVWLKNYRHMLEKLIWCCTKLRMCIYVHVTVHRNKNLYNKTNQMHQFPKYTPAWNSTCFGQFLCPSSGVYSLYAQQWYMLYSFRTGPGWNCSSILVLLDSCLKTCMTYTIAERTVNKILMMGRGIARNTWGSWQNKLEKLVHLVGLL